MEKSDGPATRYNLRPRQPIPFSRREFIEAKIKKLVEKSEEEDPDFEGIIDDVFIEDGEQEKRSRSSESPEPERRVKRRAPRPALEKSEHSDSEGSDRSGSEGSERSSQGSEESAEVNENGDLADLINDEEVELSDGAKELLDRMNNPENEEWGLDTAVLGTLLEKKIVTDFPEMMEQKNRLYTTIIQALAEADKSIVEEYCEGKPKDTSWKIGLPDEKVSELEPKLVGVREIINLEKPTLAKILEAKITDEDRAEIVSLFDIYKNLDPFTEAQFNMGRTINKRLREAVITEKAQGLLNETRDYIREERPTLSKILNGEMSRDDRARLVELFDTYKTYEAGSEDSIRLGKKIMRGIKEASKVAHLDSEGIEREREKIMEAAPLDDHNSIKARILRLNADDNRKRIMFEVLREMGEYEQSTNAYRYVKEKLEWMLALPYKAMKPFDIAYDPSDPKSSARVNEFCVQVRNSLDNHPEFGLFGMSEAKDEIIAGLNNRITNPRSNTLLALWGRPGTGKSSLAASMAKAAGLPFYRVSFGGLNNPVTLAGSDFHYSGSSPSIFLKAMKEMQVCNGVVLLDEIDKISKDEGGTAVLNVLLHVIDYTTNKDFRDKYLTDYGHDLSNLWFIATLNDRDCLPLPLKDRLNIIEVEKYTRNDFKQIMCQYTLPRILADTGIPGNLVSFDESGVNAVLTMLGGQIELEGVRPVQRIIRTIISRINLLRTTTLEDGTTGGLRIKHKIPGFKLPIVITADVVGALVDFSSFLGDPSARQMYM